MKRLVFQKKKIEYEHLHILDRVDFMKYPFGSFLEIIEQLES